jgi:SAM-dependent methyltransferase
MTSQPVTSVPAPPMESMHRLPPARLVDRIEFVLHAGRGRRVIHLGFVDETRTEERQAQGSWLHGQLARVAEELVGIDSSRSGVEQAVEDGYEAHVADLEDPAQVAALALEPADLVVAGELVEHLANPGRMLEAIRPLLRAGGLLVLTTPNAHALTNVLAALLGLELVNSDHVGWQSWWTARELLARHGYRVTELAYYPFPRLEVVGDYAPSYRRRIAFFNAYLTAVRPLYRVRPSLADGLILVASAT